MGQSHPLTDGSEWPSKEKAGSKMQRKDIDRERRSMSKSRAALTNIISSQNQTSNKHFVLNY